MSLSFDNKIILQSAILLIIVSIIAISCNKTPDDIIAKDELSEIMAEELLAEIYEQSAVCRNLPDSVKRNIADGVLKYHGISQEDFDKSVNWYGRNLDEYIALYDLVDKKIEKRKKIDGDSPEKVYEENDIWNLERHYWFSPISAEETLLFEQTGETLAKGDILEWRMHINSAPTVDSMLGVDYTDGSSSFIKRTFRGDKSIKIPLITDTAKKVVRIYGFISLDRKMFPIFVDSLKMLKLPFDSILYNQKGIQKEYCGPGKVKMQSENVNNVIKDSIISISTSSRENLQKRHAKFKEDSPLLNQPSGVRKLNRMRQL